MNKVELNELLIGDIVMLKNDISTIYGELLNKESYEYYNIINGCEKDPSKWNLERVASENNIVTLYGYCNNDFGEIKLSIKNYDIYKL